MNLFLYLFYHFAKLLVKISTWVFYRNIYVKGKERGQFDYPCIIVSNHPSTMLDPLNTAVRVDTQVSFLANASLFKSKLGNWFFNTFYCIPIERYKDTGGKPLNNKLAFAKSNAFLSGGGCLYMAPEGNSYVERRLRRVKTGAARIALGAEESNDFQLGLKILPVALNYEQPTHFQNDLFTIIGEPIQVTDFQKDFEENAIDGVRKLTERIAEGLGNMLVNTRDEEEDKLLKKVETLIQTEIPLTFDKQVPRTQKLLRMLRTWQEKNGVEFDSFCTKINDYFSGLTSLKISDLALQETNRSPLAYSTRFTYLILQLPFFILGYLSNFLACFVPGKINDWFNNDNSYDATFKCLSGLVTFPLFYGLQIWLVDGLFDKTWLTLVYALSIIPLGLLAASYLTKGQLFLEEMRVRNWRRKNKEAFGILVKKRKDILLKLEGITHR